MAARRVRRHHADHRPPPRIWEERGARQEVFCQIEALETAIYITEVVRKYGNVWSALTNHKHDLRFRALLRDGEPEVRFERVATG